MTWVNSEHSPMPDPEEPDDSAAQASGDSPPTDEIPPVRPDDEPTPVDAPTGVDAPTPIGVVDEDGDLLPAAPLIEEPPIDPLDDTAPSLAVRPDDPVLPAAVAPDDIPMWRRVAGLVMLLLAAALTITAGLIIFVPFLQGQPTLTATPAETVGEAPTLTPLPTTDEPADGGTGPAAFTVDATLSPEQVAALLANPPSAAAGAAAIQRQNNPFTIIPDRPRAEVTTYTIAEGDTVEGIAERFNLEKDTIAWSNDRNTVFALRPGNELYIMPVDGVYHRTLVEQTIQSIADKYEVDPYDIINSNFNNFYGKSPEMTIPSDSRVVVPGGTSTYNDWTYNPVVQRSGGGGGSNDAGFISFAPGQPGSCGSQGNPGGTGYFVRPVSSYSWSRGFTGYHTGVDLAGSPGTPIFASSNGRVIYRGWNDWGYGYLVVLAHGPFTTFYAHLSSINVGCGQMVSAGQVIGGMGSSGNSSGPHLHFEVRYNDIPSDPLLYVGF